jgi:hypothetical protein
MTEAGSSASSTLIKTDKLGRMRTSAERREMLLDEFEQSGMSGAEFAKMIGIHCTTFAGWRQRRNKRRQYEKLSSKSNAPNPLQLVEAVVADRPEGVERPHGLMVHLPGGARLELSDACQVPMAGALLRSLQPHGSSC